MKIKIRDWLAHFERDRTKQWKHLGWVPVPNKQGAGYRKIMKQSNGLEIFAIWIALIQVASTCDPRGDLSKYSIEDLSDLTLIGNQDKIKAAITFLSQVLDWIEVVENLDVNVKNLDVHGMSNSFDSSILFNSVQSNSIQLNSNNSKNYLENNQQITTEQKKQKSFIPPTFDELRLYCKENGYENIAEKAFKYYSEADWHDSRGKKIKNWKQKLQGVWFREENKDGQVQQKKQFGRQEVSNDFLKDQATRLMDKLS